MKFNDQGKTAIVVLFGWLFLSTNSFAHDPVFSPGPHAQPFPKPCHTGLDPE